MDHSPLEFEVITLRAENATLKEQVAQLQNDVEFTTEARVKDYKQQLETITQQAEVIEQIRDRVKWIQKRCAGDAMPKWENTFHTTHSRGLILDQTNAILDLESSPEILQARDERVAEACASVIDTHLNRSTYSTSLAEMLDQLRSGEWRKYL